MTSSIAAVLFDLDNTLADRDAAFDRVCEALWSAEPAINSAAELTDARRLMKQWDADGHTLPKRLVFEMAESEWGRLSRTPPQLEAWYESIYPTMFVADQQVLNLAGALDSNGVPWGIVTNGPPFQSRVIEQIGLGRALPRTVISAEFGHSKPDPEIFAEGLRLIGMRYKPGQCLFVGDNPSADVIGAKRFGMQAAWLRRGRGWTSAESTPDYTIEHVAEIEDLLSR